MMASVSLHVLEISFMVIFSTKYIEIMSFSFLFCENETKGNHSIQSLSKIIESFKSKGFERNFIVQQRITEHKTR